MGKWTRRAAIGAGGLVGGGLLLGIGGIAFAPNRLRYVPDNGSSDSRQLTTWIKITPDNCVTAIIPHCEMGQGALTGIAMMLAEEMEADWDKLQIEEALPEPVYANGYMLRGFAAEAGFEIPPWLIGALDYGSFKAASFAGLQVTGGSSSTRSTGQFGMRIAGAAAKQMLLEAAATQWNVAVDELSAARSEIVHRSSNRTATFGELASDAAQLAPPRNSVLKSRDQFELIGTPRNRADIPSKVDGSAHFGIDTQLPDMLYAAITTAPVWGSRLISVETRAAKELPGVHAVVQLENSVAVVADGYWQAQQALRALAPVFTEVELSSADSDSILAAHVAAIDANTAEDHQPGGATTVTADYRVPYLAHATMEPMSATARVSEARCEIWAGTQDPLNARRVAADAAGINAAAVDMHNLQLGGGFGRRLPGSFDYIEQAVQIAKAMSPRPVKLIWSREQDMQHDYYRPAVVARMTSTLDAAGRPLSWTHRFTGDGFLDAMGATPIYDIDNTEVDVIDAPVHLRTGSWRSVAFSQHGFFMESFVDELAAAAGQDPLRYRLDLLRAKPRHLAVLERAAAMAAWSNALPQERARGVAILECFGTIIAQVAEVSVDADGSIRVHRFDAAVDCGTVVNPNQAAAQIEGGIVFGLSAALLQQITVRNGAVEQNSFPDFEMIRMATAPRTNVEFIESDAAMGGLGEPGVPPVAPAVANAVFALTGQRLRALPLRLSS